MQRVAARQESRVSRAQLVELGYSSDEIDGLLKRRHLNPEHRGVYALGAPPWTLKGAIWSAVLAAGDNAIVSHRSAAYLSGYLPSVPKIESIDITITSGRSESKPGIRIHHSRLITSADIQHVGGLRVTRAARTMLDLAATVPEAEFEEAFDEAVFKNGLRRAQVEDVLARNAGAKGIRRFRDLWEAEQGNMRNRLAAEKRMALLIEAAKLGNPASNAPVGERRVDFLWPELRVIVETDGYGTHGKRSSFEADRARDAGLSALDYYVLRFTWRQLTSEPYFVVARLAARLALAEREMR